MATNPLNLLGQESSPYLLQHKDNPVNWVPWSPEAFEQAAAQNKLVLISIGYSACHWCHVMEHQSFENEQIAEIMNAHFICIKVDREERPDVDQIYMDAVQLMTGRGGWPLNCFTMPNGQPIYGGTYFPPAQWAKVLQQLAQQWRDEPAKVAEYGKRLTEAVQDMEQVVKAEGGQPLEEADLHRIYGMWSQNFDPTYGGEDRAPKFPMPVNWRYLLQYGHTYKNAACLDHVHFTLKSMSWGGLYDQVGGGYTRYSTDTFWLVPHFEKMLYDNGQLLTLLGEAYRQKQEPYYAALAAETVSWMQRELLHAQGGFYSALDADSEGEEGKFYVWTKAEIESLLGEDAPLFIVAFNISAEGNWEEGKNIPFRNKNPKELAADFGLAEEVLLDKLNACKAKLLAVRNQRIAPGLDDKILCSWNALAIRGLAEAYRAFGEQGYLDLALNAAHFIEKEMADGDRLHRSWKNGQAKINAYLEDYANLIDAYLALYEVTLDEQWLHRAHAYTQYVQAHYFDAPSGMFFYTSDEDPELIAKKKDLYDNVIPAANSTMAHNLLSLSVHLEQEAYRTLAIQMLENVRDKVVKYGSAFANWARLYLRLLREQQEVVTTGPNAQALALEVQQVYQPLAIFAGGNKESQLPLLAGRQSPSETRIFVCKNKACKLPVSTAEEALAEILA